ncbi:MAG: aldo/keto reductase [Ruminococcus sp.]|nr:aldo/keto reductase [Ruminococcus sp.]
MRIAKLGRLTVSAEGFGCMGLSHAYGNATDRNDAIKIIRTAYEMGCTFFDTAECYTGYFADGTISYNEELVGEALAPYRNNVVISTKFGVSHSPEGLITDSRPEIIRKSVEGSLKRLGTDHIDLYYQHRQDVSVPVEEVAGVMSELIKEGKILYWGLSEVGEETIRKAYNVCPVTAIQNRYHMMYRNYESLFPTLEELNIGFVAFSPLANGLLSDKYTKETSFNDRNDYRSSMPQFKSAAYDENKSLFELIRTLSYAKNCTPAQLSLAWMMCKKPYIVPIPGTRKTERLSENLKAADVTLSAAEISAIDKALDEIKMSDVFGGSRIADK